MQATDQLLSFQIKPESIEPTLSQKIQDYRQAVDSLLEQPQFNWQNLMAPLAELDVHFHHFWSPISHINNVNNTDAMRNAYNLCIPLLSNFSTEMGQNKKLFTAIESISAHEKDLDSSQQVILKNHIRDFKLSGVDLDTDKKNQYKLYMVEEVLG